MSQSNKCSGIGFEAEDEPRPPPTVRPLPPVPSTSLNVPSQQRPAFEKNSTDFLEAQTLYAKMRSEIEASFHGEREAAFKKSMTARMKAEIRRGMVLDVQEEYRKMLLSQKEKLIGELRKEVRKEVEREMGLAPEREKTLRERVRKEVREEMREEWEWKVENARRETWYEMEEKISELEEENRALKGGVERED
jgi:hypothetical protein